MSALEPIPRDEFGDPDFCSDAGAAALKRTIEAYWRERGGIVNVELRSVGFHPAIRGARKDVRSDMLNGLPRIRAVPSPEQEQ